MIIDFHAHTFPEEIAEGTVRKLARMAHIQNYLNGTLEDLRLSMMRNEIEYTVLLPVATRLGQQASINRLVFSVNENTGSTGILSFGAIHPDDENYRKTLRALAKNGVKGIKLHPVFQKTDFDDIRYMRIIECACENGLIIVTHTGYDVSLPDQTQCAPEHIVPVLDTIKPDKLVLAHMGGWRCSCCDLSYFTGRDVYIDTSFSMAPSAMRGTAQEADFLSQDRFTELVKQHGARKVLFGSDSPWTDQGEAVEQLKICGFSEKDLELILGENARKLLSL